MAYLIRIKDRTTVTGRTEPFVACPIRIGRNPLNDLVLEDEFVSQWHGVIQAEGGSVWYVDLGSTNGTIVNGTRAAKHLPIPLAMQRRDQIVIGETSFSLAEEDVPAIVFQRRSNPMGGRASIPMGAPGGPARTALYFEGHSKPEARKIPQSAIDAAAALSPAYTAHRAAWAELLKELRARLVAAGNKPAASELAEHLLAEMPALSFEPELRELLESLGLDLGPAHPVDLHGWLRRIRGETPKPEGMPASGSDVSGRVALERVGGVLEAMGDSLLAVMRAQSQFRDEMGLRIGEATPLHKAKTAAEALNLVLDWDDDGAQGISWLRRGFVDVGVHQIAMMSGVIEGTRALLRSVSPETIANAGGTALARQSFFASILRKLSIGADWRWTAYERAHAELVDEDRFTRSLFGTAFARAYLAVTGGSASQREG